MYLKEDIKYPGCLVVPAVDLARHYEDVIQEFVDIRPSYDYLLALRTGPMWLVHWTFPQYVAEIMRQGLLCNKVAETSNFGATIHCMPVCCPANKFGTNDAVRIPIYFRIEEEYGICVMQRDTYSNLRYVCVPRDVPPNQLQLERPDVKELAASEFSLYLGVHKSVLKAKYPKACSSEKMWVIAKALWGGADTDGNSWYM